MRTFEAEELDRIIEMAWEDRTTFEAIHYQFGLSEQEVIELMRQSMKASSFRMWRKRVSGRKTKQSHQQLHPLSGQVPQVSQSVVDATGH